MNGKPTKLCVKPVDKQPVGSIECDISNTKRGVECIQYHVGRVDKHCAKCVPGMKHKVVSNKSGKTRAGKKRVPFISEVKCYFLWHVVLVLRSADLAVSNAWRPDQSVFPQKDFEKYEYEVLLQARAS